MPDIAVIGNIPGLCDVSGALIPYVIPEIHDYVEDDDYSGRRVAGLQALQIYKLSFGPLTYSYIHSFDLYKDPRQLAIIHKYKAKNKVTCLSMNQTKTLLKVIMLNRTPFK